MPMIYTAPASPELEMTPAELYQDRIKRCPIARVDHGAPSKKVNMWSVWECSNCKGQWYAVPVYQGHLWWRRSKRGIFQWHQVPYEKRQQPHIDWSGTA